MVSMIVYNKKRLIIIVTLLAYITNFSDSQTSNDSIISLANSNTCTITCGVWGDGKGVNSISSGLISVKAEPIWKGPNKGFKQGEGITLGSLNPTPM